MYVQLFSLLLQHERGQLDGYLHIPGSLPSILTPVKKERAFIYSSYSIQLSEHGITGRCGGCGQGRQAVRRHGGQVGEEGFDRHDYLAMTCAGAFTFNEIYLAMKLVSGA
jgi:hypothetical protein